MDKLKLTKQEKQMYQKLLDLENEGKVEYEIGCRGGYYGVSPKVAVEILRECSKDDLDRYYGLDFAENRLPRCFGAYQSESADGGICQEYIDRKDSLWEYYPKIAVLLEKLAYVCTIRYEELVQEVKKELEVQELELESV